MSLQNIKNKEQGLEETEILDILAISRELVQQIYGKIDDIELNNK